MKKFEVVLCETNSSLALNAAAYFQNDADVHLIVCNGFKEVAEAARVSEINGLVIDVEFPSCREIVAYLREKNVKIFLLSKQIEGEVEYLLESIPHEACFYKPYSLSEVRAQIMKSMMQQAICVKLNTNMKNIDERLSGIFIRAGIPPHIKGYQFLREAVKLSVMYPEMINSITKKLYPSVAEVYNTTASKVERAIRHAIEVAWNRGKIENINAIFGIKIYSKGEKPTNGELIALVADKIMIESM
jgi:two-component system response regulator (stage 0 sporulation protein A)